MFQTPNPPLDARHFAVITIQQQIFWQPKAAWIEQLLTERLRGWREGGCGQKFRLDAVLDSIRSRSRKDAAGTAHISPFQDRENTLRLSGTNLSEAYGEHRRLSWGGCNPTVASGGSAWRLLRERNLSLYTIRCRWNQKSPT